MAYTEVTVAGYNNSPPSDDGATDASNRISWSKIKTSLFDPLKSAIETMNTNIASAVSTADTAVTTLSAEVTALATNIANITTTLNAPTGTAKLFQQTTPPTGWTKFTGFDDYALRLTTGTISTGGSTAFTSVFANRTITTANLPSHTHSFSDSGSVNFDDTNFLLDLTDSTSNANSGSSTRITGLDDNTDEIFGSWSISGTTGSSGSGAAWNFAVRYCDCIVATRG